MIHNNGLGGLLSIATAGGVFGIFIGMWIQQYRHSASDECIGEVSKSGSFNKDDLLSRIDIHLSRTQSSDDTDDGNNDRKSSNLNSDNVRSNTENYLLETQVPNDVEVRNVDRISNRKDYDVDRISKIERHLLQTQKPAQTLGIRVHAVTEKSLSLSAPLDLNHNVHGTAFAGSLFSISILASYYLACEWMQQTFGQGFDKYILVAKSANIKYRRPVKQPWIIATSYKPELEILYVFQQELQYNGKSVMDIKGDIYLDDGNTACKYSIEVCAYDPSKIKTSRRQSYH